MVGSGARGRGAGRVRAGRRRWCSAGCVQADAVVCAEPRLRRRRSHARYGLPRRRMSCTTAARRAQRPAPRGAISPSPPAGCGTRARTSPTLRSRAPHASQSRSRPLGRCAGPNGQRVALAHLHPLGVIDERTLAGCLSARPVFVSAARYEPFGLAVLEAALAGCPLVLADIPTFRELWDGAALFVDPGDATGFADAIERARRRSYRSRLTRGDLARRRAARFAPRRMAGGMVEHLCTAARSRAPSGGGGMRIAYFTHSLASCWNHGNAHFLRGVLRELIARGHEVRALEPDRQLEPRQPARRSRRGWARRTTARPIPSFARHRSTPPSDPASAASATRNW